MRIIGMNCPHCGTRADVRTSLPVSRTMREAYFQCPNLACGHTWMARIEAVRTITPSALADPSVHLPISSRREAERIHDVLSDVNRNQRSFFDEPPSHNPDHDPAHHGS